MIRTLRSRRSRLALMPMLLFVMALRAFLPDAQGLAKAGTEGWSLLCSQVQTEGRSSPGAPHGPESAHCDLCLNPFVATPPAEHRLVVARVAAFLSPAPAARILITVPVRRAQTARGPPVL